MPKITRRLPEPSYNNEHIFNSVYRTKLWGNGSGSGSTPDYTQNYRKFLQDYLKANDVKSVVDLGCGDWKFSNLIDWSGIEYVGVDVSSDIIKTNQTLYTAPGISFVHLDAEVEDLPNADLVITKDCLQHLSNESVNNILKKLRSFDRILITQDISNTNSDCKNGGYRKLDLRLPPFNLPMKEVFNFNVDNKTTFEWLPNKGCRPYRKRLI